MAIFAKPMEGLVDFLPGIFSWNAPRSAMQGHISGAFRPTIGSPGVATRGATQVWALGALGGVPCARPVGWPHGWQGGLPLRPKNPHFLLFLGRFLLFLSTFWSVFCVF